MKSLLRPLIIKTKFPKSQVALSARVSLDSKLDVGVSILERSKISHCNVSRHTYISGDCNIERTEIGPFCSIGPQVMCGLASHPLDYISTYPGFYSPKASGATWFGTTHEFSELIPCKIGGDVWIGARAVILGGVKIGHGAVIGAGAIVTKDIPPHAIAVGVPAKVVRYRFAQSLSEAIIQSQWWEAPEDVLRQMAPLADKPEEFLANLARIWVCDDTQSITGNT